MYTEKAGVNQIILDSAADMKAVARNVAFSLSLYTGQMCTAPQNIYVPRDGIDTAEGRLSFDQVAEAMADGVRKLLGDPARAVEVLGAVQNDGVLRRLEAARSLGKIVLDTQSIVHPAFPDATVRTPLIVKLDTADRATYLNEWFGPIAFVIATADTDESLAIARDAVRGAWRAHAVRLLDERRRHRARDRRRRRRGCRALDQSHRRRVRESIRGVLRFPRHRRQSGGQRIPDRRGIRREPLPRRAAPDARLEVTP